jgi:hypothetical protein
VAKCASDADFVAWLKQSLHYARDGRMDVHDRLATLHRSNGLTFLDLFVVTHKPRN